MIRKYIIVVDDSIKGFDNEIARLEREWGAEEIEPCDDVVSRQTVLQCIKESREGIDWGQSDDEDAFLHYTAALYRTIASKECLPSVQPQPKMGEWIKEGEEEGILGFRFTRRRCSKCGWTHGLVIPKNYCPNCGSYNGGDEDGRKSTD